MLHGTTGSIEVHSTGSYLLVLFRYSVVNSSIISPNFDAIAAFMSATGPTPKILELLTADVRRYLSIDFFTTFSSESYISVTGPRGI